MKKVLTTALVVLMVASTVFAGFSGSANINLGYDFDTQDYGFKNGKNEVKGTFELNSESAEKKGEGSVYAGIVASMKVAVKDVTTKTPLELSVSLDKAYVKGDNFEISILENKGGNDYAVSAIDKIGNDAATYAAAYDKVAGVNGTVYGYKFGFGLVGNAKAESFTTSAFAATPAYTLAEGLTLEAGVQGTFDVKTTLDNKLGWGAKVAYKNDDMSASVASDMGLILKKGADDKLDAKFDADVAAAFSYAPVSVDLYYATKVATFENLLSVKVAADLKDYAPVTVALYAQDLVNTQQLSAEVGVKLEDLKLNAKVSAGYTVGTKAWSTGASVDYTIDQIGKLYAGFNLEGAKDLTKADFKVGIENTTLINNATLKAEYAAKNFVDKQYGALTTSCTIAF